MLFAKSHSTLTEKGLYQWKSVEISLDECGGFHREFRGGGERTYDLLKDDCGSRLRLAE